MGILAHPGRSLTAPVAQRFAATLQARGLDVWQFSQWDEDDVRQVISGTDMVVAIGGDGAMLRATRVCAPFAVPVLGVNMGYLGFLTEIQREEDWEATVDPLLAGKYWIEQRMMIAVTAYSGDQMVGQSDALNDAVISRGAITRLIRLDTYIDGDWTTTYNADALIIATPTGSTAYALASGGPILPPELRNILVVPVAPHLSLERPIVLPEGAMIEVLVTPDSQAEIVLAADGETLCDLCSGDRVHVQASEHMGRFVRLRERSYFYRSLLDRLEPRAPEPPAPPRKQL
jgi:NAD+ kinase